MSKKHKHYSIPEMVDLGLPSGLKWAKCNIGASKETDYGLYFKYGEAEGHTSNELNHFDTNYPAKFADAATAAYGSGYRMPTMKDFEELIMYTYNSPETVDGVKGKRFTSKTDSSKYIFIPFAGYCNGSSFYDTGRDSHLWSRTLSSIKDAYNLYCYAGGGAGIVQFDRNFGFPVRAVSDLSKKQTKIANNLKKALLYTRCTKQEIAEAVRVAFNLKTPPAGSYQNGKTESDMEVYDDSYCFSFSHDGRDVNIRVFFFKTNERGIKFISEVMVLFFED